MTIEEIAEWALIKNRVVRYKNLIHKTVIDGILKYVASTSEVPIGNDDQITLFTDWVTKNYHRTGPGEYVHHDDRVKCFDDAVYFSTDELLNIWRKQLIPPLPSADNSQNNKKY